MNRESIKQLAEEIINEIIELKSTADKIDTGSLYCEVLAIIQRSEILMFRISHNFPFLIDTKNLKEQMSNFLFNDEYGGKISRDVYTHCLTSIEMLDRRIILYLLYDEYDNKDN